MKRHPLEPGRVVRSKMGRDRDRYLMVVRLETEEVVLVVDGDLRKLEKPKRKNAMHLHATPVLLDEIARRLAEGQPVQDAEIRKSLELAGYGNRKRERNEEGEAVG